MASDTYHQIKIQSPVLWEIGERATYVCTKYTKILALVKNAGAFLCHDLNWPGIKLYIPTSSSALKLQSIPGNPVAVFAFVTI